MSDFTVIIEEEVVSTTVTIEEMVTDVILGEEVLQETVVIVDNAQGPQGNQGIAATITVGDVTTVDNGVPATVTNSGTSSDAVFDFELPEGPAATIEVGDVTTVDWDVPATVTNSGTTSDAVFDFELPQGRETTVTVGTVTTGAEGTDVTIVNSGDEFDAVLDFTIPVGDTGTAATISVGTVTTGDPGTSAAVINSGTSQDAVLNFTIPEGEQGIQGIQGIQGEAATVAVGTTTTGTPGDPASVTNSGTANDAVFNFVIPEGLKGDKGDTGDTGATGATGADITDLVADLDANGFKLTNVGEPSADTDAATKSYVDNAIEGLSWKDSANLLSTSNTPLTGSTATLVIDGHSALDSTDSGYRIVLTAQSTTSENGIYVYSDNGTTYTLSRSTDADTYEELIGASVFIKEGTLYGQTAWLQTNHYLTSFSGQTWVQFSGLAQLEAGVGLTKTGNTLDLDDTAVTPGTYTLSEITVDQQGRITAASTGSIPSGIVTTSDTGTVTSTMIADGTIVDADVNASAAIAATKVQGTTPSGGTANQVLKKVDGTDYNTTWGTIAGAVYQPSAPSTPQTGDVWVDSDAVAGVLNQNDYLTKNDFELFTTPIGGVTTFAGTASPSNKWAICDGTAVSRTTYSTLFTVIGTTYGVGDGTTTFNLPNLKGRVVVGVDAAQTEFDALGETGGAKTHTLTSSEIPAHSHPNTASFSGSSGTTSNPGDHTHAYGRRTTGAGGFASGTGIPPHNASPSGPDFDAGPTAGAGNHAHTFTPSGTVTMTNANNTGGGGAHNNLQPYIALNYLIRIA